MRRGLSVWAAALLVGGVGACTEESPTSLDPDDIPGQIRTVEIEIPWSDFGTSLESFDGFGSPSDIGVVLVANQYEGVLNSRALVSFRPVPFQATVRDSAGTLVTDTMITVDAGRVVFDVIVPAADSLNSYAFEASALDQPWSPATATWDVAIDDLGDVVPWDEPGAGPARFIGGGGLQLADSAAGDSVVIELDAETLTNWADTTAERSLRIDLATADERVRLGNFRVFYDLGSSIDPDTTVLTQVSSDRETFIYTPEPEAPGGAIRAGGAPAWRSVFGLDIPRVLNGPAELCEIAGCPYTLLPEALNRASIVLETRPSPAGFAPTDSVFLDTRPVLAPDALPKSPLGGSFIGNFSLAPELFAEDAGEPFEIQISSFVEALLRPDRDGSEPSSIALLSAFEPFDVAIADFAGPDDAGAPRLRLLVTVSDRVNFR